MQPSAAMGGGRHGRSRRAILRLGLALPSVGLLAACGASGASGSGSPPAPSSSAASSGGSVSASTPAVSSSATNAPPSPTASIASLASGAASAKATGQATSSATSSSPAAAGTGACVLSPEMTDGPYYIDEGLVRNDITEGKPGVPLQLRLTVQSAGACRPIADATVELWHCDAGGVYSGYSGAQVRGAPGGGPPPNGGPQPGGTPPPGGPGAGGGGHATPTDKLTFLRGGQRSDSAGAVTFQTIYPGWYMGRATHIHVKVHVGGAVVHTGQLFMDDAISDAVYAQAPYAAHGKRETTNANDGIYASGGAQSMLALSMAGSGYVGSIVLGVNA